jgi:hypothetical protein
VVLLCTQRLYDDSQIQLELPPIKDEDYLLRMLSTNLIHNRNQNFPYLSSYLFIFSRFESNDSQKTPTSADQNHKNNQKNCKFFYPFILKMMTNSTGGPSFGYDDRNRIYVLFNCNLIFQKTHSNLGGLINFLSFRLSEIFENFM